MSLSVDPVSPLLAVSKVAKSYGGVAALRSADLIVSSGQCHALLGANGAGKSTLVKVLTGIVARDSGDIFICGRQGTPSGPVEAYSWGLAPVFQDPALVPDLTVRQNLKLTGASLPGVREQLNSLGLATVDVEDRVEDIPLPTLRMIDLARALSYNPKLLILDEITAALPSDWADLVFGAIEKLKASGSSVLFISHRLKEVIDHCDMCTILRDGRAADSFVPTDGGQDRIVAAMLGETRADDGVEPHQPSVAPDRSTTPSIEVNGMTLGQQLVDVSFSAYAGEVLGVVALEGQGQDVLFDMLAGERKPDSGTLVVNGIRLNASHPADAVGRGVVLVPADRVVALLPQRSIQENVALALHRQVRQWGFFRAAAERARVAPAITRLAIDARVTQTQQLSGGNQQKVTIAKWLAAGFSTLLLFDPTRGIDVGTKLQIYDLVRDTAKGGATVIMYTSELREVALVCDRVIVLYQGRVIAELESGVGETVLLEAMHGLVGADAGGAQ